jgi:hypothetical protein
MGLYTVRETREIVREALVDASSADDAVLYFKKTKMTPGAQRVDVHKHTDECHIIVKEYEEADE